MSVNVTVLHVKDEVAPGGRSLLGEIGWGELPINHEKNHKPVAEIRLDVEGLEACDEAYRLTQNIDQSWTLNEEVYALVDKARSTHIGDVILVGDEAFVCCPLGWEKVVSPEQKVKRGAL